ncbi:DUF2568 domain-containing protein [Cohnella thermotolerans]|uniref:DUF2568 domain-containing protein n=1 Tax=Cohnella thermotolerans TaxID=329858 RepID=UPI000A04A422
MRALEAERPGSGYRISHASFVRSRSARSDRAASSRKAGGPWRSRRRAIPVSVPVRALLQAAVFAAAALALCASGQRAWAIGFIFVAAVDMMLVYALKL